MIDTKKCSVCGGIFTIDLMKKHTLKCIDCYRKIERERAKKRRLENLEEIRKKDRERYLNKVGGKLKRKLNSVKRDSEGKTCITCKEHLPWGEYTMDKNTNDGYSYICKNCNSIRKKQYRNTMKGKIWESNYKIINKEVQLKSSRNYYNNHKDKVKQKAKERYAIDKNKIYRDRYEKKICTPGTYVLYQNMPSEVIMYNKPVVRIRIIGTGKHVLTYKSNLKLWKSLITKEY